MAATAWALAGCGSSSTPSPSAMTSTSSTSASATQPSAVQDVNPPGDIPDTQAYVAYTMPSNAFKVKAPEGWSRADAGTAVTFSSHYNTMRLETVSAGSAPTVASAQDSEAPAIQRQGRQVTIGKVSTVARSAGQAVLITYQADSPPDPVTNKFARLDVERYEFWRAGTEAIITLSSPAGSDNVDPWRTVTESFQWL
jgi:hypothetical protein